MTLLSLSLMYLLKSSYISFSIVSDRTSTRGDTYAKINPTLKGLKNWLKAMNRKKRLKKWQNWLNSTIGRKVRTVYFVFFIIFCWALGGITWPEKNILRGEVYILAINKRFRSFSKYVKDFLDFHFLSV